MAITRTYAWQSLISVIALVLVSLSLNAQVLHNAYYRVCFTPQQNCTSLIVNAINHAKHNIKVQAYSFTSTRITNALINAKKRGVDVSVILDKSNLHARYSRLKTLIKAHIPVYIDSKLHIAHNKIMLFDNNTVLTGSFNFSSDLNGKIIAIEYISDVL